MTDRLSHTLCWGDRRLELGRRTCVMGILNTTPDSFSDGGRFVSIDAALAQAEAMVAAGADILDIGGESTRPFSDPVSEEEETRRVLPVIERLADHIPIPISIDTMKAAVARRALDAGAAMINDVSALRMDADMASVAARYKVPIIVMHMLGTPKTMQKRPVYQDLLGEIGRFLEAAAGRAEAAGVDRSLIIADPGIGFGKTADHNLALIQHLASLKPLGLPLLIGPSRKAFIRSLLSQGTEDEPSPDSPQVETGTQAAITAAILNGAHVIRVHNVADTRATARIADALLAAGNPALKE
ncbi:MAG: dihydropteroate synthase [Desulfobacterales bacterium]|nr:dihydropteroate synthase [Desulfobacterales bacterium]